MKFSRHWLWLLLVPVIIGFSRLHFDVEVLDLLPADVPAVKGLKILQQTSSNARQLIITVQASDAEATESAARSLAESLRHASNLTESVTWQPPWLEHPEQNAELIAYIWLNQNPAAFQELSHRLSPGQLDKTLADTREQMATSVSPSEMGAFGYDPFGFLRLPGNDNESFGQGDQLFTSPDGRFRVIFVQARPELRDYRQCIAWISNVRTHVAKWRMAQSGPEPRLEFTGAPAFQAEIAGGMQKDMTEAIAGTSLIIAILFWLAHRRLAPMLWLLTLLVLILGATLALGGLVFGTLNVVSLGFAGILLGLAVDYGVVHYQEAMSAPRATIPEIRRAIGPSIFWAAVTTITAFLILNLGDMPGLAQLGTLVAMGIALSAAVMLFAFLPPLLRNRRSGIDSSLEPPSTETPTVVSSAQSRLVFGATALLLVAAAVILGKGLPPMDRSGESMRPTKSTAYHAALEIQKQLSRDGEPVMILVPGTDEATVRERLEKVQTHLQEAVTNGLLNSFLLPLSIWPNPANQQNNKAVARELAAQREAFHSGATKAGFTTNSWVLADRILDAWKHLSVNTNAVWPSGEVGEWITRKVYARHGNQLIALGMATPSPSSRASQDLEKWILPVEREGSLVSSWDLLGPAVLKRVQKNVPRLVIPMLLLVGASLWFAFRRPLEILLSIAVLILSALGLLAVMRCAGWTWNVLNLMALPLMLGTGVDYSIFMQLALRRHVGDIAAAHKSVGRALLLCGATAMAGFGSLAWSSNAGIASLGAVCAVGIGFNMLLSVFLLPVWWRACAKRFKCDLKPIRHRGPSALYGALGWRFALTLANVLPRSCFESLCILGTKTYWSLAPHRRKVIETNLLPLFAGNRDAATAATWDMATQFGLKLADLWRYESGAPVDDLFAEMEGWQNFEAASKGGRGVLLLTPHLGNWEFGAPVMKRHGVKLLVITLKEPGLGLTEIRKKSRALRGIETFVIGEDPFAFVEIIKRLEAGAAVALLVDRPPAASAVEVDLFGQSFTASIAAAELARVSGCALLPVYLPRTPKGYAARMLPEIPYDRRSLGNREARRTLTAQIMRAFEPVLRQYPSQWYHFVPIWPKNSPQAPR